MRSIRVAFLVIVISTLFSTPRSAWARGWQGVIPGTTTTAEVITRFGQPSTQGKLSGRSALVFKGDQAISGTRQAQFLLRDSGVVAEIIVFPASRLGREEVAGKFGSPSLKSFTDDFKDVWMFRATGVTVFFGKEGTVESIRYAIPEPGGRSEPLPPSHPPRSATHARAPNDSALEQQEDTSYSGTNN